MCRFFLIRLICANLWQKNLTPTCLCEARGNPEERELSFDFKTLDFWHFFLTTKFTKFYTKDARFFYHKRHIKKTKETKFYRRLLRLFTSLGSQIIFIRVNSCNSCWLFSFDFMTFDFRHFFLPQKTFKKNKRNKVLPQMRRFFLIRLICENLC